MMSNNRGPPMQQPSFTASGGSAPIGPQGSFTGGPPQGSSAVPMSAGRGGAPGHGANGLPAGPRGGGPGAMRGGPPLRGQKSGFVPPRGGGPQGMRGRGGGAMGASAPRGGMPMSGGPLRSHGSRGGFNGGRRGGFNGQGSFRARGGHAYGGRGPRGDAQSQGASEVPLGPSAAGNAGRKDENRRTLTDFKLVGFEFLELGWSWGVRPDPEPAEQSVKVEPEEDKDGSLPDAPSQSHVTDAGESTVADSGTAVKEELQEEESTALPVPPTDANPATSPEVTVPVRAPTPVLAATAAAKTEASPPSRLRIYFHTPASLDDARASSIPPSVILEGEGARPGKRKKGADGDDDDSAEEGRARPRPPGEEYDRGSVAPSVDMDGSVAPSIAESDWLMAAFGGEREHGADSGDGEHGADAERQRTEPLPDTVEGDTQPPVAEEADVHEDGAASQETVPDELPAHDESGKSQRPLLQLRRYGVHFENHQHEVHITNTFALRRCRAARWSRRQTGGWNGGCR
jgi:20S proteasome subunit alpha 6